MNFDSFLSDLIIAVTGLLAVWFVGYRLSAGWDLYRRQRELDMAAAETFYETYGEFFAVWKLWHAPPHRLSKDAPQTARLTVDSSDEDRLKLLQRAAAAEGSLEALLVKLAVERSFDDGDQMILAKFRQGFQCLRESIERGETLRTYHSNRDDEWKASTDTHGRGAAYLGFRDLAVSVASIVCSRGSTHRKTSAQAASDLIESTDVDTRMNWWT